MPLYEFLCPECGWREEFILHHTEKDHLVCPRCHTLMEAQLSVAEIHMKGFRSKKGIDNKNYE